MTSFSFFDVQLPLARLAGPLSSRWSSRAPIAAVALCFALSGCRTEPTTDSASAETKAQPAEPAPAQPKPPAPSVPVGPPLIVQPGKGLSAIRFGATRETVERHMQAPCDVVDGDRCIYIRQATVFDFDDEGVLERIEVHLRGRPVPGTKDKLFGMFRGMLLPRIMLGLHRHVVLEEYGEPEKKEAVKPASGLGLVDRHFYDGLILEYDKLENGNTVLAGFEIFPSETAERVTLPTLPPEVLEKIDEQASQQTDEAPR